VNVDQHDRLSVGPAQVAATEGLDEGGSIEHGLDLGAIGQRGVHRVAAHAGDGPQTRRSSVVVAERHANGDLVNGSVRSSLFHGRVLLDEAFSAHCAWMPRRMVRR
jgi:hypothetical protein